MRSFLACFARLIWAPSTAIGVRCKDGIVLGVEKMVLNKLLVEGTNRRIANVDRHVGVVRVLVLHVTPEGRVTLC